MNKGEIAEELNELSQGLLKLFAIPDVSGSSSDEYRKCANCSKEMNMTKKEYMTLMDRGMHRYVCTSKCMLEYYR